VIEQKHGDDVGVGVAWPLRVRILGARRAELAANAHELVVARLAARAVRRMARAPQLVIAGRPEYAPKSRRQLAQGEREMLGRLADVAGDDEPVVRILAQRRERRAVESMAEMEVADREQSHERGAAR